jgi:predicted transcriptional regulator
MEMNLDILRAIQEAEGKPTRIMSVCNMTWSQLHEGLNLLARSEFIKIESISEASPRRVDKRSKNKYHIAPKGDAVLRYFRKELGQVENLISSL